MEFTEEFSNDEKVNIANEFLRLKDVSYLDLAGAGLYGENQIKQIYSVLSSSFFCNPHTLKSTGDIVDQVRFR